MLRYHRYIAQQLLHSMVLTALSLTSIVWLTQALRLMDTIVNQGVGLDIFLLLTVLILPSLLLMVLPVALFCSVLFIYHKLRTDSELTVLEAAGLSLWKLSRPALTVALAVTVFGYAISLYLMPVAYAKFRDLQLFLRNNYVSVLLQEGVFNSPVDGLTVFVRERDSGSMFRGILVHDNRDPEMSVTMMAEEGTLSNGPAGQRFLLKHGNRQELRGGRLSLLNFESYVLDLSFYSETGAVRMRDPRELFLPDLLQVDGLSMDERVRRRGELHQRILWPLYGFTMTLIALSFLLSGEFSRRGGNRRIILAVLTGSGVMVLAVAMRNQIEEHRIYVILAYAIAILPVVGGSYILSEKSPPRIGPMKPMKPMRGR